MAKDTLYTNGVIAVREKFLLNDKISKLCENDAEECLRALLESGFAKGVDIPCVQDYEKGVVADEKEIDAFIKEYSPTNAEREYLLCYRDFHNAKAIVKAHYLNLECESMLAGEGLIAIKDIFECVRSGKLNLLCEELSKCVKEAATLFEGEKEVTGAEIGIIFERGLYTHLLKVCSHHGVLKKLVATKADMTNILTALRAKSEEDAKKFYLPFGAVDEKMLSNLFLPDSDKIYEKFKNTPYYAFVKKCVKDKLSGKPLTDGEKICESYEGEYFSKNRFELKNNQPFLYYVFRRRIENANIRILFVCLLAGLKGNEIRNRLRIY